MEVFDWDDANREPIAEHGVTCQETQQAILNDPIDIEVQEDLDDGFRYRQIGATDAGRILILLSTVRGNAIRVVTAWDATKAYRTFYLEQKTSR